MCESDFFIRFHRQTEFYMSVVSKCKFNTLKAQTNFDESFITKFLKDLEQTDLDSLITQESGTIKSFIDIFNQNLTAKFGNSTLKR